MDKKRKICFKCSECDVFKTKDEQEFFKHLTSKHKPQFGNWCGECGFCFYDPRDLISHIKNRGCKPANVIYPCGAANCKFTTKIGKELVQHVKSFHRGTTFTTCIKCKKFYTVPHLLVLHIQDECNSNLKKKSSRATVKESLSDDDDEDEQREGHENDSRSSRRGKRRATSSLDTSLETDSEELECDYCSFTGEKAALELHVKYVHSIQGKRVKRKNEENINRNKFRNQNSKPCPLRYKATTESHSAQQMSKKKACFSEINTNRRTRSSALKYQCGYCIKKAPSLEEIKSHHSDVHDQESEQRCFFFPDEDDIAEDDVLYKCTLCDKGPDVLQKIKRHWQDLHGPKSYRLKVCLNFAATRGLSKYKKK